MPEDEDNSQESTESEQSTSEPERDSTPPDIELVLNSEDPDKYQTKTKISEEKKK